MRSSTAHIVEQDRIDAKRKRLLELRQRIDLDLDLDHVTGMRLWRARSAVRMSPASAMWLSLISTASSRPKR